MLVALLGLWILASIVTVWRYWPQPLSYYNLLMGGLPGAARVGMEPTYYWDSLDASVLDWLHTHTGEDEKIAFASASPQNLALLAEWDLLRRGYRADDPGSYRWYVVQRRPSAWTSWDRWLIENAAPAYQKIIRPDDDRLGPLRLDVPLLDAYRIDDYERACRAVERAAD